MTDPFRLDRFTAAQDDHGAYARALAELRRGRKTGHWIWFVFPQIAGLGTSSMSTFFAISSLDEARAYLAHPVLGNRLRESAAALLAIDSRDAAAVLGGIDAVKVRSSMTLFHRADPDDGCFAAVLDEFFGGEPDPATLARI